MYFRLLGWECWIEMLDNVQLWWNGDSCHHRYEARVWYLYLVLNRSPNADTGGTENH